MQYRNRFILKTREGRRLPTSRVQNKESALQCRACILQKDRTSAYKTSALF